MIIDIKNDENDKNDKSKNKNILFRFETKHFIYFYLGQVAILLFKSG